MVRSLICLSILRLFIVYLIAKNYHNGTTQHQYGMTYACHMIPMMFLFDDDNVSLILKLLATMQRECDLYIIYFVQFCTPRGMIRNILNLNIHDFHHLCKLAKRSITL